MVSSDAAGASSSSARSTSPAPLLSAPPSSAAAPSSRRLPPPCWTNDETHALIDSYQDKWYALRRGNLRAPHWQEVADALARRCYHLPAATPKTAVQCRHKIEKLRKRYRAERQRSLAANPAAPPSSPWILFRKMDAMECGGSGGGGSGAKAARPEDDEDEDEDEEDDDEFARNGDRLDGATPYRDAGATGARRFWEKGGDGAGLEGMRFKVPKAVRSKIVGSRAEERAVTGPATIPNLTGRFFGTGPGKRRDREEVDAVEEMVSSLRMLGERFLRMEQMKMEQAREMERVRMEIELKHTEMIIDSQRRIVDAFVKELVGKKRAKASPES